MARTYSPGGKGHHMLARLEEGPARGAELWQAASPNARTKRRRQLYRVVNALRADGLSERDGAGFYSLTAAGAQVLATLRQGEPVTFHQPLEWRDAA